MDITKFNYTNTPSCDIRIVQISPPGTGSTVTLNLLHGLLCPACPIYIGPLTHHCRLQGSKRIDKFICKSHCMNYYEWQKHFGALRSGLGWNSGHKLYFVTTQRRGPSRLRNRSDVLVIPYKKILETKDYSLENIVDYFYLTCKNFLPQKFFTKNESDAKKDMYKRIDDMNKLYEEIKHKSFQYKDTFYGLHGGHRCRKSKDYYSKYK